MMVSSLLSPEDGSILAAIAGQFEEAAFATDVHGVVLLLNPAAARLFGLSGHAAAGEKLAELFPPQQAAAISRSIARVRDTGEAVITEDLALLADGKEQVLAMRYAPVRDSQGKVCAVAGTARAISPSPQHAEINVYRRVIENLPDCLNVKDSDGRFLIANEATADLMQARSAADLIGKTDFDFYPPGVAETFREDERRILESGLPQVIEQQAIRRDGKHVILSTLKVPLRDEAGKVTGLITHNRDITGEKLLETQLAVSQRHLTGSVVNTPNGLAMFDPSGVLIFCNQQYRDMYPGAAHVCVPGSSIQHILKVALESGAIRAWPPGMAGDLDRSPADLLRTLKGAEFQLSDGRWVESRTSFAGGDCLVVNIDITEHRKVLQALEESEQRYRVLEDLTNEAWWEEDIGAGRIKTSRRFIQMLGLGEDMLDCPMPMFLDLIHPKDVARAMAAFNRAVEEDADYEQVFRMRHADGHYMWVEDHGRIVLRDGEGKPLRMQGSITDISARRQVEIALKESEERYRKIAEITQEAWWEENLQAGTVKNSRRFREILGLGEEILDCPLEVYRDRIHPDDQARVQAAFERAVKEGVDFEQIYRLRHADGHYIWAEDHGRILVGDADGKPTRMLGALTDITARRQAEIALQESEENFRRLFDDAPDAYIIMDQVDGTALACNQAAARMLRGTREQVVGLTPDQLSPPFQPDGRSSREAAGERVRQIVENGYLRFEWMHRCFDGTDFWAEVTATVGSFRQRPVLYVTWREMGEIIAAKQAAEAASIAKSQFLSVISHELRTPLNAIIGTFQLIGMEGVSARVQDFASRGLSSSDHLLKLVEEILDFSSIEAGRLAVVRAPFRLETLLDEVSQLSAGKRIEAVDFRIVLDDRVKTLELSGDALRLKQVLINLLGNAFKFTDHGSVVLSVTAVGGTPEIPLLEFSVEDTGVGLTPGQKNSLFQPFTQLDMSNVRRFGGTGLGLAISQQLVSLMGGEPIEVESRPGLGSRFAFRMALPLAGDVPAPETVPAVPAKPSLRLAGYRVLLAEDSETIRLTLRLLLESEGAVVEEALDGAEAVNMALAAATPYDSLLMDMQMPVKDGLEATRELRARGFVQPIVALTSSAFAEDRQACLAAGMNDHVAKPVKIDDLVGILRTYRRE